MEEPEVSECDRALPGIADPVDHGEVQVGRADRPARQTDSRSSPTNPLRHPRVASKSNIGYDVGMPLLNKGVWELKGVLLGACSCDWGCPCNFDATPTQGICEGAYVWKIEEGSFRGVPLAGLHLAWLGKSPGPMHQGNVTALAYIDEAANSDQRQALSELLEGKSGGPWTIFKAVTAKQFGPKPIAFSFTSNGLNSSAQLGSEATLELAPILNPVTGNPEELYLDKPTGFTSKRTTLGATKVLTVNAEVAFDHSGKYGEFSHFEYSGTIA